MYWGYQDIFEGVVEQLFLATNITKQCGTYSVGSIATKHITSNQC